MGDDSKVVWRAWLACAPASALTVACLIAQAQCCAMEMFLGAHRPSVASVDLVRSLSHTVFRLTCGRGGGWADAVQGKPSIADAASEKLKPDTLESGLRADAVVMPPAIASALLGWPPHCACSLQNSLVARLTLAAFAVARAADCGPRCGRRVHASPASTVPGPPGAGCHPRHGGPPRDRCIQRCELSPFPPLLWLRWRARSSRPCPCASVTTTGFNGPC
jgi:hypothetical protein